MAPEGVVLPAPAIGQALGLSHRGEQLGVEEFVPEPAVERLGIAVLLWRAWLDARGCGAAVLAPSSERVGNELGAVITADEPRSWLEAGELLQHGYHDLKLATSPYADLQVQTTALVDHVQKFQPPAVGGGVELEIHSPDLMRVFRLMAPHVAIGETSPLKLYGVGR